jgi:hypothetical protein
VIDRKRVRELKEKRPPRTRLVVFLDRTESDIQKGRLLLAELEGIAEAVRGIDPGPANRLRFDLARLLTDELGRFVPVLTQALAEARSHRRIELMRLRSRRKISISHEALTRRIAQTADALFDFLGQAEGKSKELLDEVGRHL